MQSLDRVPHCIDPLALRGVGAYEKLAEIGVEILLAYRFENPLRKISLPRQCPESVALGAGVVAASSRENYGKAPPTEAYAPHTLSLRGVYPEGRDPTGWVGDTLLGG